MSDGDLADDADSWYRIITLKSHITRDGKVADQFLKGRKIAPPRGPRPWSHELSGRLVSLAAEVDRHAEDYVEKNRKSIVEKGNPVPSALAYHGVAHACVNALRPNIVQNITSNVVHTPILPPDEYADGAHADFVMYGADDTDLDRIRTALQGRLTVHRPPVEKVNLERLCVTNSSTETKISVAKSRISSTR